MKTKVFIRADGSVEKGLGHLVRCIALAHMIKSRFQVHFVCQEITDELVEEVENAGFLLHKIDDENLFLNLLSKGDLVVADLYDRGTEYQKAIRARGTTLICIDDLHDQAFYADLIINHAPGIGSDHYIAPSFTQFALGPDYALLRPPFLRHRSAENHSLEIKTIFLCFGGSDNKGLTLKILQLLVKDYAFQRIIVVTGSAYSQKDRLSSFIASYHFVDHHHAVNDTTMAELIGSADLAIVPSSGILLEVLALGTRAISGMYIENQRYLFENYKSMGAFVSADDFSVEKVKKALDTSLSNGMPSQQVVDGRSGERLLKRFLKLEAESDIQLRRATISDLNLTYTWASDQSLRIFSFNQSEISLAEHSAWFAKRVTSPSCYYYLAECQQKAVGYIRFEIDHDEATISYLVDKDYQNKGLGTVLIKKGLVAFCQEAPHFTGHIIGYVLPANIASRKIFETFGFESVIEAESIKYRIKCK